jgi:asparagine synthase (glutamine-hydrolysing)
VLARDRLGEKPLYYHRSPDGERLSFASEIKALLSVAGVPRAFNDGRLAEYLTFRTVSGPETMFRDIRELEPGSLLVAQQGRVQTREYWSLEVPVAATVDFGAAASRGAELLVEAVRSRLVSDVPLGALTSGGLDSSLASAMAAECRRDAGGGALDTFCVGFDRPEYDEREFARLVAHRIGSRHHELVATAADIDRELDALTWAHDEPLTHPNSIPMHMIFRFAKQERGVTVLLSGEGADELFGGYAWYAVARRRQQLQRMPGLLPALSLLGVGRRRALRRVRRSDYLLVCNAVSDEAEVRMLSPAQRFSADERQRYWPATRPGIDGLFLFDQRTYLVPLLQRQDRMSMAAGVEARVVFLDHALVEWMNAVSGRVKLRRGVRKAVLRAMARGRVPASIIHRRKVGFTLPLDAWLRPNGPLYDRVRRLSEPSAFVRGVLDARRLDRLLAEHATGVDHAEVLWTLIALESWATRFLGAALEPELLPGARPTFGQRGARTPEGSGATAPLV